MNIKLLTTAKQIKDRLFIAAIFISFLLNLITSESLFSQLTDNTSNITDSKKETERVVLRIKDLDGLNERVEAHMKDLYPLISDESLNEIKASKYITKYLANDTLGIVDFYLVFDVPKHFLSEPPKILWELNIPEFQSRIFQIYNNDTILIDVWPNVVGKPSTRTYTGYYKAFRLRNWPFWKDPEAGDSVRPTPPGPNNPLGLFVVHYDENSLRYFHGTNKNHLLKNEYRALSHGCVRNDNANIAKMKEFIIKKMIKSDDLNGWLGSKKSMIYEIKDTDQFPIRITYKLFDINSDENGDYIIFFKDIYNYSKNPSYSKYDVPELMTFINLENILNEFKREHILKNIPDEKLIPIIENLISNHKDYTKYYFNDLIKSQTDY